MSMKPKEGETKDKGRLLRELKSYRSACDPRRVTRGQVRSVLPAEREARGAGNAVRNRWAFWKEENLVINADCGSWITKVEKDSKGRREKENFSISWTVPEERIMHLMREDRSHVTKRHVAMRDWVGPTRGNSPSHYFSSKLLLKFVLWLFFCFSFIVEQKPECDILHHNT